MTLRILSLPLATNSDGECWRDGGDQVLMPMPRQSHWRIVLRLSAKNQFDDLTVKMVSVYPRQKSRDSGDLLQLQQETILGTHFQSEYGAGGEGYSSEYIDSLLAKEFTSLSVQERTKTYEEIHGVSDYVDETPAFVEQCLWQLDMELSNITEKTAYYIAEQQNKAYVTDSKFRLMFLRAACFHPQRAATRLVAFFEGKLRFFGLEPLTRQLQWSDLDQDDKTCFRAGHLQVLPTRDRSGRPVFTDIEAFQDHSFRTPRNRLKVCIFLWLMMAEDEENQKRGVVSISILMGSMALATIDPELVREFPRLDTWLPLRSAAMHQCTDHPVTGFILRTATMGLTKETRIRQKFHLGT